jgi:hypothetical protein
VPQAVPARKNSAVRCSALIIDYPTRGICRNPSEGRKILESTMFFGAGTAVDPAQRASRVFSAYFRLRTNKKDAERRLFCLSGPAHGGLGFASVFTSE